MSGIQQLDKTYDLWLSVTWWNENNTGHGISGHTYELMEYYYLLKDHYKVGIFFADDTNELDFSKYTFTEEEIQDMKDNTVYGNYPTLLHGTNILFVDGEMGNNNKKNLIFDNILYFACGDKGIKDNTNENVHILQDDRVYEPVAVNGINYKKKILFSKLKRLRYPNLRNVLVYGTNNCRDVSIKTYKKLSRAYRTSTIYAITSEENRFEDFDNVECLIPPVENLFSKFQVFIYTPVERKWDCSPRFIAECKHYNKDVIYHGINYLEEDKGLYWRKWDIENDFESLHLKEDDEIICIIDQVLSD